LYIKVEPTINCITCFQDATKEGSKRGEKGIDNRWGEIKPRVPAVSLQDRHFKAAAIMISGEHR